MIRHATLIALVAAAQLVLWTRPIDAQTERWPIKKFQVVPVEPSGSGKGAVIARFLRQDGLDVDFSEWEVFRTIDLPDGGERLLADIEEVLVKSANIMESAGFPPPQIEPVVELPDGSQAYRVYLVDGLEGATGEYHPDPCNSILRDETVILLDLDDVASGPLLTIPGRQTAAHELFHAVQFAMPFFSNCGGDAVGSWIVEGTARTVGWAVVSQIAAYSMKGALEDNHHNRIKPWGLRDYSNPLAVPYDPGKFPQSPTAYKTSSFWSYLAEMDAAGGIPPRLGSNPYKLDYLARFLSAEPSARDCNTTGSRCNAEVAWLDGQVRTWFGKPLREIYAHFVQAYALYGEHRIPAEPKFDKRWIEAGFSGVENCQPVPLGPSRALRQQRSEIFYLPPVSTQCWEIMPEGFPDWTPVLVKVEMLSTLSRPSIGSLNAIQTHPQAGDGIETAKPELSARDRQTVEWELPFRNVEDGQGTIFLLSNVADAAEHTPGFSIEENTALEVTFTPLVEYAYLGEDNVDGGEVADAIDTPLEIELDSAKATIMRGNHVPAGEGSFAGTKRFEGIENPCYLVIEGTRKRQRGAMIGDHLVVHLLTAGPITKGSYEIASFEQYEFAHAPDKELLPAKMAGAATVLSEIGGLGHNLAFVSGVLEIDLVSSRLIAGTLRGVAAEFEYSTATGRDEISETRTLAAQFSLRPKALAGRFNNAKPYACLGNN